MLRGTVHHSTLASKSDVITILKIWLKGKAELQNTHVQHASWPAKQSQFHIHNIYLIVMVEYFNGWQSQECGFIYLTVVVMRQHRIRVTLKLRSITSSWKYKDNFQNYPRSHRPTHILKIYNTSDSVSFISKRKNPQPHTLNKTLLLLLFEWIYISVHI